MLSWRKPDSLANTRDGVNKYEEVTARRIGWGKWVYIVRGCITGEYWTCERNILTLGIWKRCLDD